jgi:predicted enzyme related to lactoylglutathione lyase
MAVGALSTVMLVVSDMGRSVRFYRDVLGLEPRFESRHFSSLAAGPVVLGLHGEGGEVRADSGTGCTFGFEVSDMAATLADLRERGAEVVEEPRRENFGWLALIADPDGYLIQLREPVAAGA